MCEISVIFMVRLVCCHCVWITIALLNFTIFCKIWQNWICHAVLTLQAFVLQFVPVSANLVSSFCYVLLWPKEMVHQFWKTSRTGHNLAKYCNCFKYFPSTSLIFVFHIHPAPLDMRDKVHFNIVYHKVIKCTSYSVLVMP